MPPAVPMTEKGHPKGLYLLFAVEAWERFSYYGMRALLVLYMVKSLKFSTETAGTIYGWYTGLVYLTPLIGGYIADRYLGQRACILIGGGLMALGHFAMAFPPLPFFFSALVLLILGNGFFKPNISTVVGSLYGPDDPRRDSGFVIFYMGINLGAFFSPLVCGSLGELLGWHYGFGAAGVGMVLGLAIYLWLGNRYLGEAGKRATVRATRELHRGPLSREEKHRIGVIFILAFFVIWFWSAFEQAGSSMTLFADRSTDRTIPLLGWEMPASWFQSVNPLLIFILAPLFSRLWIDLAGRGREPSTPMKMAIGLGLLALGFVVLIPGAALYEDGGLPVSMLWLLAAYLLHTLGELCLSPVGLSAVTKLSPPQFVSLMMGCWFGSNFLADLTGGLFSGLYDSMPVSTFFVIPAATAGAAALILFFLVNPIRRLMHGVH